MYYFRQNESAVPNYAIDVACRLFTSVNIYWMIIKTKYSEISDQLHWFISSFDFALSIKEPEG